jgi:hypothetical protein
MKPKKRSRRIAEEHSGVMTSEVMSEGYALQYGIQIVRSGSKNLQVKLHLDLASSILEGHFVLTLPIAQPAWLKNSRVSCLTRSL